MSSVKVAVILPSRGLMFSRTAEELLRNLTVPHKIYFSHRKPIPECFEEPTNKALKDKDVTHLWFVEDDMVLPDGTLESLLEINKDAVACDYPVTKQGKGSVFKTSSGIPVFSGTGCLLVKRRVFELIKKPYFRTDIKWTPLNYGATVKLMASGGHTEGYGFHDVTFGIKLWLAGVPLTISKLKLAQRKLKALGKPNTNNGAHDIEVWRKIIPDFQLKKINKQPLSPGAGSKLVTVDTPSGAINTSKKHADNLVKQGVAEYPPKTYLIVDKGDLEL